ncbi:MAG: aminotransferase class V-fold PLP-dependent enzyme [Bacteroidota bacterium]
MTVKEINISSVRKQFPLLHQTVNGKPLVYFDNGATSQKPQFVIDAINKYYSQQNANIHRGVHYLSQEATTLYEQAREKVKTFLNAEHSHEIIFTSGTTASINTIAYSFGKAFLKPGDEILISAMEHHSNIVPWQIVAEQYGAQLKVIPINKEGEIIFEEYKKLLSGKTKIISVTHVSNSLGTINPVKEIIAEAHQKNIPVLIDGAQAIQHGKINVQELDADFYVFSGHKMYGPTGTGILYGKEKWLNTLPPFLGGGDMIKTVTFEKTVYNDLPHKFEAGTPNIEGGIALGAAIDFIYETGFDFIQQQEKLVLEYATKKLTEIPGLKIIGTSKNKASVISFNIEGLHPYDVGTILDQQGIAVRTGHHCTQPLMDFYKIPGTIRASMAFYNTIEEIDKLIEGVNKAIKMLK